MELETAWEVFLSTQVVKLVRKFQKEKPKIYATVFALVKDLEIHGPILKWWLNFGLLHKSKRVANQSYHCHICRGKPTYVACWKVNGKQIEVYYVGTHENAPY